MPNWSSPNACGRISTPTPCGPRFRNITGGTAVLALSADRAAAEPTIASPAAADGTGGPREVLVRTLSAAGLSGLLAGCLYFGWPYFHLLILGAAGLMAWEWAGLCGRGSAGGAGLALMAVCAAVVALASFSMPGEASLVLILGAPAVALLARPGRASDAVWLGAGALYVGGGAWAAAALFDLFRDGAWAVAWIFWVVALTDIGAFLAGRALGGAKLAPRLSPNKTWSGFFGGLAFGALAGLLFALAVDRPAAGFHIAAALVASLVAQGGDLFESLLKRRFGAKDSGKSIPGHGGLLDRVDGVVPVLILVAALASLRGGVETLWL
ncbi:MAG: phosphatidate cytidylyltransferase [Rhodospirillaceae bacterium]|nr:phosphatidate cytidylyltransferase [Rhodospirillaceae bacterium]MYB14933.1 phosphatidate cytidylyltransferase [Rhodospirillaceae bacterium]MYI47626.1 phosphatidate cytidylyltransferase [Rhodospirillaceae bacterium]